MSSVPGTTTPTTPATTPPTTTPTTPVTTPPPVTTPTTPPPVTTPTTPPPVTTSITTAPTPPPSTAFTTSTITQAPPPTQQTSIPSQPTTIVTTISSQTSNTSNGQTTSLPTATSNPAKGGGGLSPAGKTAIAVIIPIVAVALLIIGGIFLWRRRNKRKADEEDRRKELDAYDYNPNNDPSLPMGAVKDEGLVEDGSGYRGWGPAGAVAGVGRKTSTNASSNPANFSEGSTMYQPTSPTHATYEMPDGTPSGHHRNGTMDSDVLGSGVGAAAAAGAVGTVSAGPAATGATAGGLQRGPSNASSTYSAGGRSQHSNEYPIPYNGNQEYYTDNAYYQAGPYEGGYNNGGNNGGQPIMRESPARRLTQINEANARPQQGGISRNF